MNISGRLVALVILLWLSAYLLWQIHAQSSAATPDSSRVVLLFAALILTGTSTAILATLMIVGMIGQRAGAFFFSPEEKIEPGPHDAAIALLSQGDAEGAIAEYQRVILNDPNDSLAWSEMAKICCRNLDDTARGSAFLEEALQRDWPEEQGSFLANRLADVYLEQEDVPRAQMVLQQIVEAMPGTKFAANARHRISQLGGAPARLGEVPALGDGVSDAPPQDEPS